MRIDESSIVISSSASVIRQEPSFVRATVTLPAHALELDVVHEALADLEPSPPPVEGVVVESFSDLRASKLTCFLRFRDDLAERAPRRGSV